MDAFLNGRMIDSAAATISAQDAGFQHAVGLFETMSVFHGQVFRLGPHLERLRTSAAALGLARDLEVEPLERAVRRTLEHNELSEARLRLTVTAGNISMLRPTGSPPEPTVLVVAQPPTVYDPAYFEKGVMALVALLMANPFDSLAGHKTLSYWARLRVLRQAAAAGAGEAIVMSVTNHLAGGAISNLFLVKDDELLTPLSRGEEVDGGLPSPVLPGITRAAVIELAASLDIHVSRRMLAINDLLEADEVFLTNSSWQVLPVTRIEKKEIGEGRVGPVTAQIRSALLDLIERETGSSRIE